VKLTKAQLELLRGIWASRWEYLWLEGSDVALARKLARRGLLIGRPDGASNREFGLTDAGRAALEDHNA
jgi:hypothetical protein